MSKLLLIVDDEVTWRTVLSAFFRRYGFRTSVASGGSEALAKALAEPPDLVILDLIMRGTDGLEFLRAIRATETLASVPVIVVTARADAMAAEQTAKLGVQYHLVKAAHSMKELLGVVRQSLLMPPP